MCNTMKVMIEFFNTELWPYKKCAEMEITDLNGIDLDRVLSAQPANREWRLKVYHDNGTVQEEKLSRLRDFTSDLARIQA